MHTASQHPVTSSRPDALHVGFSKCASTFLQNFFQGHPGIFLVNQSHFFAPFETGNYDRGEKGYLDLFSDAQPDQVKLESDEHICLPLFHPVLAAAATTLESIAEVSARIKRIQPNARIIIVIRNQIDLIVSRYSEYILGGGKYDFDVFVNEFLNCSKDGVNYYQNYYARIIEIFRTDFSSGNVLVLCQEDLSQNESGTIERLCRFLGVATMQPKRRGMASSRVGLSDLGIRIMRSINRMLIISQEMSQTKARARVPYLVYKLIQRAVRTVDFYLPKRIKGDKNAVLTPALRERIREEFKDDNALLADLFPQSPAYRRY